MKKVLIANRGEIAIRVIRSCREMGLQTVALYADPDRKALHVRLADEAYPLRGQSSSETYLDVEKILKVAQQSGADAVHPGYGFLSENASFAQKVLDAGLTWIGPPPEVIANMGDKAQARAFMKSVGVPVVPGSGDPSEDVETLAQEAQNLGFPVMLKAVAGGGGKGIRLIESAEDFSAAARLAQSEAQKSFADGRLYLEKLIRPAHHIEIQLFVDHQGQALHLGERECSVQRRSQKLIEETPSPIVSEAMRHEMTSVATQAAAAMGYRGAGTMEFLADEDGHFYFLEMNTRLQVEHTVTEMVTGRDLVKAQLLTAMGQDLGWGQSDLSFHGHAIEIRVCAEDPDNQFAPSIGVIDHLQLPAGPGVRLDSALTLGMEIGLHFDPMLAKLVVWAPSRDECIARTQQALREFQISGIKTSMPLLLRYMQSEDFKTGKIHTTHLEPWAEEFSESDGEALKMAAVAAALAHYQNKNSTRALNLKSSPSRNWRQAQHGRWSRGSS